MNISAEPEAYFRIAPEDWLRAEMQGRLWHWSTVIPVGCRLSEADRRLQIKAHCRWLVCRGDIHKFRCATSDGTAL
ncbi:hypothetical protein ECZU34_53070 [Escherichia coli]|nr:hypothetical protein ECZU34_53070 [Escherichia coli]